MYIDIILGLSDEKDEAYKIGITNYPDRRVDELHKGLKKGYLNHFVNWEGEGDIIIKAETEIKRKFKLGYLTKKELNDGYTETFDPKLYWDIWILYVIIIQI